MKRHNKMFCILIISTFLTLLFFARLLWSISQHHDLHILLSIFGLVSTSSISGYSLRTFEEWLKVDDAQRNAEL